MKEFTSSVEKYISICQLCELNLKKKKERERFQCLYKHLNIGRCFGKHLLAFVQICSLASILPQSFCLEFHYIPIHFNFMKVV